MQYKGYTIKKVTYQDCDNYVVIGPDKRQRSDIAANVTTAKKWIDAEIAERRQ